MEIQNTYAILTKLLLSDSKWNKGDQKKLCLLMVFVKIKFCISEQLLEWLKMHFFSSRISETYWIFWSPYYF